MNDRWNLSVDRGEVGMSPDVRSVERMREPVNFRAVCAVFWIAFAMAVVAHAMSASRLGIQHVYELWVRVYQTVKGMLASTASLQEIVGSLGFVVGMFCVAASPWCARILYQSAVLRWASLAMAVVGPWLFMEWYGAFMEEEVGVPLLYSSMLVTLLGLISIQAVAAERRR
ncbi:MAG: hypothetical protein QM755_02775 [Luteolibacter sp.]